MAGKSNSGIALPGTRTPRDIRTQRGTLRESGLRGGELRDALNRYRQEGRKESEDYARGQIDPSIAGVVRDPAKFYKGVLRGGGPAMKRLLMLRQAGNLLGYDKTRGQYEDYEQNQLAAGAPVDLQQDERPTEDQYGSYVREHLGQSLSPTEEAAIRTPESASVESSAAQASRDVGSRLAAAGIDPRSGVANARAAQVANMRAQGLGDVERDVTKARLQRQQEFEGQAARQSTLEEGGRQYDVSAGLRRLSDVEQNMAGISGLNEGRREFDTTYTEGQRQSELARKANQKAADALRPSTFQQVATGVGGLLKGLGG